jgi:ubiquinone/menaquinone biosynthesis C-methylase UbiE
VSQLTFDRATADKLEAAYRARDILRRRELVYEALRPLPGERILDVGCGPGFYAAELLDRVGPRGFVMGVDPSAAMLAAARERCGDRPNVAFAQADATRLPVADGEFDAALSVQVLEYVRDVDEALDELYRALRPGGRVVIWDIDWTTLSWHSREPGRMERVLRAWDRHLAHSSLPRTLAARLARTGFTGASAEGHAFVAQALSPDAYVGAVLPIVAEYVARSGEPVAEEVPAWLDEQRDLNGRGEFFFACLQFCFSARKPGDGRA